MAVKSEYSYQFYGTTMEAWDAMYQALLSATRSIYWEVYVLVDDQAGERFIQILCDKARAGLEVKLVIDDIGSWDFTRAAAGRLRAAGVDLKLFHPVIPQWWQLPRWFVRLFYRNHRKALIIDENIFFLGGVNVKANYHKWDDIYLKMSGVVLLPLLRAFAKSYISSGGQKAAVKHLLKRPVPLLRGLKERFKFIIHSPHYKNQKRSRKIFIEALAMAKETVNFLTPYYTPDKKFLAAVAMARKRGVKVNIFLPLRADFKFMDLIARAYFRLTLKTGANVYLLPNMNHGKAFTVDDKVGAVGSFNLTHRSFNLDQESGVSFDDAAMVADLNALFNGYKKSSTLLRVDELEKMGWWSRIKEWFVHWLDPYV